MKIIPKLVLDLTEACEAWIVGSAADPTNKNPRDWDVCVPFSQWDRAALFIPPDAKPNSFGGWKCVSEGKEVDVWPGELGRLMASYVTKWVYHPKTNTRFKRV